MEPQVDQWMAAATQTVARKQDITLDEADTVNLSQSGTTISPLTSSSFILFGEGTMDESFGDNNADNWMEFDPNAGDAEEGQSVIHTRPNLNSDAFLL